MRQIHPCIPGSMFWVVAHFVLLVDLPKDSNVPIGEVDIKLAFISENAPVSELLGLGDVLSSEFHASSFVLLANERFSSGHTTMIS